MGNHDHRGTQLSMDLHQGILQVGTGQRIQRTKGFIHEQHLGLHGQGPGDAHALLHATGNFVRLLVHGMGHVHQLQVMFHPVTNLGFRLGFLEHLLDRQLHIFERRQPRQQRMVLEYHRPLRAGFGDFLLVQNHPAIGSLQQAGDDIEHCGFPAAGVADQRDEFTGINFQIHIFQRFERAFRRVELHADVGEFQ